MKKLILSFILISISIQLSAQNKKLTEIKNLYNTKSYSTCIIKAEKYIDKSNEFALPYYCAGFSYFFQPKTSSYLDLKKTTKLVYKGISKKMGSELQKEYTTEFNLLHDSLQYHLKAKFNTDNIKARFLADYLVKIYKDTTEAYNQLVLNIMPAPDAEIIKLTREGKLNQTDGNGLKQGPWKKVYANGRPAYEVTFKDGKPIGEYKRYFTNGQLYAFLVYDEKGENATAKFYNEKGEILSEGNYIGKKKDGLWKYYTNNIVVKTEEYKKDKLNGFQRVYFVTGQIYDEKIWVEGVENGLWQKFYKTGESKLKAVVKGGKLDGPILRYYKSGTMEVKGQYMDGAAEGSWTFFSEQGNKHVVNYVDGKPENFDEVENENSENYKKTLEISKRLIDPANYKNNPSEYRNKSDNK